MNVRQSTHRFGSGLDTPRSVTCYRTICAPDRQLRARQHAVLLEIAELGEVDQTGAVGNDAVNEHGCCRD